MLLINHEMDNAIGLPFVSVKDCVSGLTRYLDSGAGSFLKFGCRRTAQRPKTRYPASIGLTSPGSRSIVAPRFGCEHRQVNSPVRSLDAIAHSAGAGRSSVKTPTHGG